MSCPVGFNGSMKIHASKLALLGSVGSCLPDGDVGGMNKLIGFVSCDRGYRYGALAVAFYRVRLHWPDGGWCRPYLRHLQMLRKLAARPEALWNPRQCGSQAL
jgi:hypothetical protein